MSDDDKNIKPVSYTVGESDTRPWGHWQVIALGDGYIVKEITVNPYGQLSLQRHQHRSEHWVILSGSGLVTVEDKITKMSNGDTAYIPKTATHRIENTGQEYLKFIEIQSGHTLDENDIERFEDKYGRTKHRQVP